MNALEKKLDAPKSRYLLFTSAGDRSNLACWLKGKRNFDLWVTYYGVSENRYCEISDYTMRRKDGKFPNLHFAYQHFKNILAEYEAICVMDDDLIISGRDISRLFEIRRRYDLWLMQPAFNPRGKISHPITGARTLSFLRYTNFIENTCPLFRRDVLDDFMKVFDPVLVGWGTDWWFMNLLSDAAREKKVAVVDAVTCINPTDEMKGGQREINLLQDTPTRIKHWKKIQQKHNLREILQSEQRDFGYEKFPFNAGYLASALKYWLRISAKNFATQINDRFLRLKLKQTDQ